MPTNKLIIEYPGEKLCYPYDHVRVEDKNGGAFLLVEIQKYLAMGTDVGIITPLDENNQPITKIPNLYFARTKQISSRTKAVNNKKAAAK